MIRHLPRVALAPLLAIAGFWLLSQITVATWLSLQAQERNTLWAQGKTPWVWDFSQNPSIVPSGSHGLGHSRFTDDGLDVMIGEDGVASLSLALDDEVIPMAVIDQAVLDLQTDSPVSLGLLSVQPYRSWVIASLDAGEHQAALIITGLARGQTNNLLLRIEAASGSHIRLRHLSLGNRRCAKAEACVLPVVATSMQVTPERLLALRDATRQSDPISQLVVGGWLGATGEWIAAKLRDRQTHLPSIIALILIVWIIRGLLDRRPGHASATPVHAWLSLLIPIGGAVTLLLAGWPARETSITTAAVFALCVLALFAAPLVQTSPWHWAGDARAWRWAIGFTALAMALSAPLLAFDQQAPDRNWASLWRYPAWALLQQWLLMAVITPRAQRLTGDSVSTAIVGGLVFALLHAPNFALMLFTFVAGSIWSWLGQRDRALLPLVISHAVLGTWMVLVAPHWLLRSAEVGGRYLMTP